MSTFRAPIINLEADNMNCPTQVYNWIKIIEYDKNNEKLYYLCINKNVFKIRSFGTATSGVYLYMLRNVTMWKTSYI